MEEKNLEIKSFKVVILAGGGGTRMRPLSNFINKPLLPIGDIPILGRIISNFQAIGCSHFIIVYSHQEEKIIPYLESLKLTFSGTLEWVKQPVLNGIAEGLFLTRSIFLNDETPFLVIAGDFLVSPPVLRNFIKKHQESQAKMTLALAQSFDPRIAESYGNVALDGERVVRIIEKPGIHNKLSDFYSLALYIFKPTIFDKIEKLKPSIRGEKELQDAIQLEIDDGKDMALGLNIFSSPIQKPDDGAFHLTSPCDFLLMNIDNMRNFSIISTEFSSYCHGLVAGEPRSIGNGTQIGPNVYLGHMCQIGQQCQIENSYLFPNANVGDNVHLTHCIVMENATISSNQFIDHQIILPNGSERI